MVFREVWWPVQGIDASLLTSQWSRSRSSACLPPPPLPHTPSPLPSLGLPSLHSLPCCHPLTQPHSPSLPHSQPPLTASPSLELPPQVLPQPAVLPSAPSSQATVAASLHPQRPAGRVTRRPGPLNTLAANTTNILHIARRNYKFVKYIGGGGRDIAAQEAIPAQKVAKPLGDFGPGQL